MSAESLAEYIEKLREENRALRRGLIEVIREKLTLEEVIVRQVLWMQQTRRNAGLAPHDYEPARPGVSEIE